MTAESQRESRSTGRPSVGRSAADAQCLRVRPAALPSAPGRPLLVGVVHLAPLPGSPGARQGVSMSAVLDAAQRDAEALVAGGADAVIVENFGDAPFFAERVPPETVAGVTLAVERVRTTVGDGVAVGVNVLRNDVRSALGVAAVTSQQGFVRVNVHQGTAVTDQGLVDGRAAETVRERDRLAPDVAIWADVHVKHAVPLGGGELAEAAVEAWARGRADALIVSGRATGAMPDPHDVATVRGAVPNALVLIGSGLTEANAASLVVHADGAICGTALKEGGQVHAPVERARVEGLRAVLDELRRE